MKLCILKGSPTSTTFTQATDCNLLMDYLAVSHPTTEQTAAHLGSVCNPHPQFELGGKSHPAFPVQGLSELLALAIPIQCSAPGSHQSQPTSTGAMPPWADVNRALNLKLEHGCSKPGIFPVSPRKAMLPALCFVVRHVIIWHHLLSSEICWNKRNVELSLRGKNKVYSLKS